MNLLVKNAFRLIVKPNIKMDALLKITIQLIQCNIKIL